MTADAIRRFFCAPVTSDFRYEAGVTAKAVLLHDRAAGLFHLNGFVEVLKREAFAVAIAVLGFGVVFAEEVLRSVAVIAGGDCMMRAFEPAIVLLVHYVAVDAGIGVVGKIGQPLCEIEGVTAHAGENTRQQAKQKAWKGHAQNAYSKKCHPIP